MRDATAITTCSEVATTTPTMWTGIASLPGRAIEREAARQPEDRRRQHRPRIPVAKIEREQQSERRRLVGERRDEIERRERREESERGRDAEDDAERDTCAGVGGHGRTIRPARPCGQARCHSSLPFVPRATHCASAVAKSVPDARTAMICDGISCGSTRAIAVTRSSALEESTDEAGSLVRFQKQESQWWDGQARATSRGRATADRRASTAPSLPMLLPP